MKIYVFIISALLSGCVITQWDGYADEKHFEISISEYELPVKDVTSLCKPGGDILYMEEAISQELNQSAQPSDESGKIYMSYKEFRIGGSYNSFFGVKWAYSPFPKVECSLFYGGKKIYGFEAVSSKNSFEVKLY